MALTITIPGAVEATIGATAPAILTIGVGVPGATGAQGPQGDPGEGVPVGGSAGQVLAKIDGTNYNTEWVNVEGDYLPLAGGTMTGDIYFNDANSYITHDAVVQSYDASEGGSTVGQQYYASYANDGLVFKRQDWFNGPEGPPSEASYVYGVKLGATGLTFINWNETTRGSTVQYLSTGITFGNGSVQTIAFPGFNNTALTGVPTAPTATPGTSTTQLATTAFVTTADNLKADLASPTFTGTPSLPTGTTGITQTALDSTTALATTAFVTTANNLKANLASPTFSGTPTLPTGTIGTTQSPGNNTTALATTAFVAAAIPAFATDAQVITGTSGAVTLTPSTIGAQLTRGFSQRFDFISSTSTAGSGAVTTAFSGFREAYLSSSVSAGRASFSLGSVGTLGVISGYSDESKIDYSKKIWVAGRASTNFSATYVGDANTSVSCCIGGYNTNMTGNMNVAGIGWRKAGGSGAFVTLMVHNGTTFTTVATTKTVDRLEVFDWLIYSDGSGNVTLYINGVSSATTSSGPTGLGGANQNIYREQCEKTAVATQMLIHSYGGCYYSER